MWRRVGARRIWTCLKVLYNPGICVEAAFKLHLCCTHDAAHPYAFRMERTATAEQRTALQIDPDLCRVWFPSCKCFTHMTPHTLVLARMARPAGRHVTPHAIFSSCFTSPDAAMIATGVLSSAYICACLQERPHLIMHVPHLISKHALFPTPCHRHWCVCLHTLLAGAAKPLDNFTPHEVILPSRCPSSR
jgi:hypothetical protein